MQDFKEMSRLNQQIISAKDETISAKDESLRIMGEVIKKTNAHNDIEKKLFIVNEELMLLQNIKSIRAARINY
jgi:hypothetical protein